MKRASAKLKQRIVKFVSNFKGRGAIAGAVEKFGFSAATISRYVANTVVTPRKKSKRGRKAKRGSSNSNITELVTPHLERIDELNASINSEKEAIANLMTV